jgi:Na+-transporting NADH:ubiquinone oxidoreductase subunit F
LSLAFLVGPLAIGGISALLAAIIAIIDSIVNNYGEVQVNINDGHKILKVKGGSPLLATLAQQRIFIPSACGGRGSCGVCKVKATSDIGPLLPTELPYLDEEQRINGIRLSCQVKVKSNIAIEIPEELFNIQEIQGVVESIKDMTYDIKEVRVRLVDPPEINFKAGQYAQIESRPYGKIKEVTQRAYSMSSPPHDKNHLDFYIRLVPGGIVTTFVFEELRESEKIRLIGPIGDFHMRDTDAIKICIAGGSGMAPLKSILLDMYERNSTDTEVWYFFGARTRKDLFYVEELEELEKKWDNLHFISALSEPAPEDKWSGEVGLITDVLNRYCKEKIGREKPMEGYLCGSPGMIDACVSVMTSNGIPEEQIYYDKFA